MKILIIGKGISGLLLGLGFASCGQNVTIVSRPGKPFDNTPLILPELVIRLFEEIAPGLTSELEDAGAKTLYHSSIVSEKFHLEQYKCIHDDQKLRLTSRDLLISCLVRRAERAGIEFRSEGASALKKSQGEVSGLLTESSTLEADFIFDCTGSSHARKIWMAGNENIRLMGQKEYFHLRAFNSNNKISLKLGSAGSTRGGIYPVEGNRFFLCMSSPETDLREIDVIANELIKELNASEEMIESQPAGGWIRMEIRNTYSEYYLQKPVKNFFPVGDGVVFSNPVYGRGISLLAMQMQPLIKMLQSGKTLTDEEIHAQLKAGFRQSYKKWKEVSSGTNQWYLAPIRKFYLSRIAKDPTAYELILRFYQLEITPEKLILEIIKRSARPYLPGGHS